MPRTGGDNLSQHHPLLSRVRVFIGFESLAAAGVALLVVLGGARIHGLHHSVPWVLVAGALLATEFLTVRFRSGGEAVNVDMFAVPIVVGAVFITPAQLLLTVAGVAALATVIQRAGADRAFFNLANQVLGAALTWTVLSTVLGSHSPISARGLVAMSLAVLTFEFVTMVGVLVAMALTSGELGWSYLRSLAVHVGLVFPINAVFAMVSISVCWVQPWGLLLLVGPGLVLALWYRSANAVRIRYADLQLLYGFTVKLAGLSDTDEIISVALTEARDLLQCVHAELCLPVGGSGVRSTLDGDRDVTREFGGLAVFERELADKGSALLVPKGRRSKEPIVRDYNDLMAVPIRLGDLGSGLLMVANHEGELDTFKPDDLRLFEALAANLSTALTSSQRLDRLRLEVAAREHQALHDSLTGLANRTLFSQWVSTALQQRSHRELVSVMLMDLDGFKDINDTLGHHTGDSILKEVAGRALAAAGPDRLAARLGGDEFAFVIAGVEHEADGRGHPRIDLAAHRHRRPGPRAAGQPRRGHGPPPRHRRLSPAPAGRRRHVLGQDHQAGRGGL
jgi:GGDEF domain-containing protein